MNIYEYFNKGNQMILDGIAKSTLPTNEIWKKLILIAHRCPELRRKDVAQLWELASEMEKNPFHRTWEKVREFNTLIPQ